MASAHHPPLQLGDPDRPGFGDCTGCHVCALPCPVFHQTRDLSLTLHGRARALLAGATPGEVAASTLACVVCGACDPVCPEDIDTVGMTTDLRRRLTDNDDNPLATTLRKQFPQWLEASPGSGHPPTAGKKFALLCSPRLNAQVGLLDAIVEVLGGSGQVTRLVDAGDDLAARNEAGLEISATRRRDFLASLPSASTVIALDGLLLQVLRRWQPGRKTRSLGEALLRRPEVVQALQADDMLIIDSRGFHAEHTRLVKFYDRIRAEQGCDTNLDLQRVAIPTGAVSLQARMGIGEHDVAAQVRWILEGRKPQRLVVEAVEDLAAFRLHTELPVCHLAEVARGAGR